MPDEKMTIFFIHDVPMNISNGQATHVRELFRGLNKVSNLLCFMPKVYGSIIKSSNNQIMVPIINKPIINHISYQFLLLFFLSFNCVKKKPDIIYIRLDGTSLSPLIASRLFRVPYFVEVNGSIKEQMNLIKYPNWMFTVASLIEKHNLRQANRIIAVTEGIKEELVSRHQIPESRIIVVPNGANTDLFKPISRAEALKRLSLDPNFAYVVFVGGLSPWQGIEYIIKSATHVLNKCPNVKFLIVGDGIMKNSLIELTNDLDLTDNVLFIGPVSYEQIPLYINAADICIAYKIPLKSGYSPLKLYEYMACGRPVITSDSKGLEFLGRINAGICIEPENSHKLAETMIEFLSNRAKSDEMGKNGREYIASCQSWTNTTEKLIKIFKDTANSG